MEKEQKNVLGGFEVILDSFVPKTEEEEQLENFAKDNELENQDNNNNKIEDPVLEKMKKDGVVDKESGKEQKETKPKKDSDNDKDTEEEQQTSEVQTVKEPENTPNSSMNEETMVTGFFDAISEKLGWENITDEEKPKDVEALLDYFSNIIEQESKPQYASEEIEALDNFVKQGGDLRKYFAAEQDIDLDNIDITDENNQKLVVRQLLKEKGFSDKQINKKIDKYVDAGLLEDEAEDAVEDLKEIAGQKKEQLLKEQKMAYDKYIKQQQQFCDNVVNEIKNLNNIRGIAIPEKDKRVLIDYILKPDSDGMTKYQKDYRRGGVKSLIESAYFTMNADKLINSARREGNNSAIEKLKNNLRNTSINTKSKQIDNRNSDDTIWGSFTRHLRMS